MDMRKFGRRSALAVAIASIALAGCDSGDDSSTDTIRLSGGKGGINEGRGGYGGTFRLENYTGAGSLISLARSGKADAGFDKANITIALGSKPLVVAADLTIAVRETEPATGVAYLVAGNTGIFISDGDGEPAESEERVTGLYVKEGQTLTLGLNESGYDGRFDESVPHAYITLAAALLNAGTITTDNHDYGTGSLDIEALVYVGTGTSTLDLAGRTAGDSAGNLAIFATTALQLAGKVLADGRDSSTGDGGDGGYVDLTTGYDAVVLQNYASIDADGGNTTSDGAYGGSAGDAYFYAYESGIYNAGDVSLNGGNAVTWAQRGGSFYLAAGYGGDVYNSGNLTANGGSSLTRSGASGGVFFVAASGAIVNSGSVKARGGSTAANDEESTYSGGSGGGVYVTAADNHYPELALTGDVTWSGGLDLRGGDALASSNSNGGDGGSFDIEADVAYAFADSQVALLGYSKLDISGGDGDAGGAGGSYTLTAGTAQINPPYDDACCDYLYQVSGSIIGSLDVDAHGGSALKNGTLTAASGGSGGSVTIRTGRPWDYDYDASADYEDSSSVIDISGDYNLNGGNQRAWAAGRIEREKSSEGDGGYLQAYGVNGLRLDGNIEANGGRDSDAALGQGGHGGDLSFATETGDLTIIGKLSANGGYGSLVGGDGGYLAIDQYGGDLLLKGSLKANGGNAKVGLEGSTGGDGGYVCGYTELFEGLIQYTFGTGTTDGEEGVAELTCAK